MYNGTMYLADLHIHSKYSRATGKNADIPNLDLWARRKGVALVGTGDFTHPAWREELARMLEPAEEGLYRVKEEYRLKDFCDFAAPRFGGDRRERRGARPRFRGERRGERAAGFLRVRGL